MMTPPTRAPFWVAIEDRVHCVGCGAETRRLACMACLDWLEGRGGEDKRLADVLFCRQLGQTLEAIGKRIGCQPERVRQLELRGLRRLWDLLRSRQDRARIQLTDPLCVLDLTVRAANALINKGCETVGDVVAAMTPPSCMIGVPNFGRKSFSDVMWCLKNAGLAEWPVLEGAHGRAGQ